MTEDISIRALKDAAEFQQCEELQRRVWGMGDLSVVPLHLLLTAHKNGGLVLGAFGEQRTMVGFVFGFLGMTDQGQVKHCSHMAGVLPEYQGQQIGYRLKLAQRAHVLAQGLALATWTYDPLEGSNASLNIGKLGVICRTYLPDVYGDTGIQLHLGLPTDRFEVEWWVCSRRVEERLESRHDRLTLDRVLDMGAEKANRTEFDGRELGGGDEATGFDGVEVCWFGHVFSVPTARRRGPQHPIRRASLRSTASNRTQLDFGVDEQIRGSDRRGDRDWRRDRWSESQPAWLAHKGPAGCQPLLLGLCRF